MEADHNIDRTCICIELDRILHDMEKYLSVKIEVHSNPVWDFVSLNCINFKILLLDPMVKRRQELNDFIANGSHQWIEIEHQLLHI